MKYFLRLGVFLLSVSFYIACSSNKKGAVVKRHTQQDSLRPDLDTVASFDDLLNKRHARQYSKMLNELNLNNADTVVFFSRTCYTFYGIVLRVKNRSYKAYHFSFRDKEEVKLITTSRKDVREYLNFFYEKDTVDVDRCPELGVWACHFCPLFIFTKMGSQFYKMEMDDCTEICLFERSDCFKKLSSKLRKDTE